MSFGIVILIPLAFIFIFIMGIAAAKGQKNKGGVSMIKTVYIYLVLFATLMMVIGGSVGVFMAAADIISPTPYYQTFENFKTISVEKGQEGEKLNQPSEDILRNRYEDEVKSHRQNQVERAKNSLIKSFGWIIIPLPVFLGVQRRNKKRNND